MDGSTLRRLTVQLSIDLFNGCPSAGNATVLLSIMAAVQFSNSFSTVTILLPNFDNPAVHMFGGCQIVDTAPVQELTV